MINNELQEYRLRANYSQAELAKLLGYKGPQLISNIERGICNIPLYRCKEYLSAIGYPYKKYKKILMDEFDRKLSEYLGS